MGGKENLFHARTYQYIQDLMRTRKLSTSLHDSAKKKRKKHPKIALIFRINLSIF